MWSSPSSGCGSRASSPSSPSSSSSSCCTEHRERRPAAARWRQRIRNGRRDRDRDQDWDRDRDQPRDRDQGRDRGREQPRERERDRDRDQPRERDRDQPRDQPWEWDRDQPRERDRVSRAPNPHEARQGLSISPVLIFFSPGFVVFVYLVFFSKNPARRIWGKTIPRKHGLHRERLEPFPRLPALLPTALPGGPSPPSPGCHISVVPLPGRCGLAPLQCLPVTTAKC